MKAVPVLLSAIKTWSVTTKLEDERQSFLSERYALTNADEVNYEQLAEVNTSLARIDSDLKEIDPETLVSKVTEEDIAKVIELWTGIPASRIKEMSFQSLPTLRTRLKKKLSVRTRL